MSRKKRIHLYSVVIVLFSMLLVLDAMLFHIDPLGMRRYIYDLNALFAVALPAPDGIRFTPGYHQFAMYDATIGLDGLRIVPDSKNQDCTIVFVGDSVTFGMGADDEDSFPNRLARVLPVHVVMAAFPGYSAENVRASLAQHEADGYVWLIIPNDDEPFYMWRRGKGAMPSATVLYLDVLFPQPGKSVPARFQTAADSILAREDVLAFIIEGDGLTGLVQQRYPQVKVIKPYTGYVSISDTHPNGEGAQQIADAMRPDIEEFVQGVCG